jgi:RNA polymerase sigma-70 factor (ECF subfamily)
VGKLFASQYTYITYIRSTPERLWSALTSTEARIADDGSLLLIQEQDRARWDPSLITEGFSCLGAAGEGDELSRFHIEAAIAACHALAPTYAGTDWGRVVELYDTLRIIAPSLVVDVNRALAVAMLCGARAGLDELDGIPEREILSRYPYALAAYADLHASLGNLEEARRYLDGALRHQASPAQHALLKRKRAALER